MVSAFLVETKRFTLLDLFTNITKRYIGSSLNRVSNTPRNMLVILRQSIQQLKKVCFLLSEPF